MRIQGRSNNDEPTIAPPSPPVNGTPTFQSNALLTALIAMRDGDFSARLPGDWVGLEGKIADTFNQIVAANARMASELERVGQTVGKRGLTRQRVKFERQMGAWGQMESSVNTLIRVDSGAP